MSEKGSYSFETPGPVELRVEVPAGAVRVATWSEPRVEVEVTAVRGDERSHRAAAETQVSATVRRGRHEVIVKAARREGFLGLTVGRGVELDVSIRCPERAGLDLAAGSTDLEAHGRLGDVAVRSASGDVTLDDTGSLSFTSASGDLAAGVVAGALRARSASGDISVGSVGSTADVTSASGDVRLGATAGAATVKTVSGDVELRAAGANVQAVSVSGDVEVAVASDLVLRIDAQSVSGDLSSELELDDRAPAGDGETLVEIRARTVSGDVRLGRSAERPAVA